MCLEPEDMRLQGDYSSESASVIKVRLEKCQGHDYCQSEKAIDIFFKTDKYVLMINN